MQAGAPHASVLVMARGRRGVGHDEPRRVALVGTEYEENLGLRYLASSLTQAGFEPIIVPFDRPEDGQRAIDVVLRSGALLCGISISFGGKMWELLRFAHELRRSGYMGHLCVGGPVATSESVWMLETCPWLDSVAVHEGELTICEVCERLELGEPLGRLPGLVLRDRAKVVVGPTRTPPNLDDLPFPIRPASAAEVVGVRAAPLLASRGCFGRCSYCCIASQAREAAASPHRLRSVESIAREMKQEYEERGIRLFIFHDDNFLPRSPAASVPRLRHLGRLLRDGGLVDIACVIKCRPDSLDSDVVDALAALGTIRVHAGIDASTAEDIRLLQRGMTPACCANALDLLQRAGIFCAYNLLVFHPGATLESVRRELDFAAQHPEIPFNLGRLEVYGHTPLWSSLRSRGGLLGEGGNWSYEIDDRRVEALCQMTSEVFRTRSEGLHGVCNQLASLCFEQRVIERFEPDLASVQTADALLALTREIGRDTSARVLRMIGRVQGDASPSSTLDFTLEYARDTLLKDARFLEALGNIRRTLPGRGDERDNVHFQRRAFLS